MAPIPTAEECPTADTGPTTPTLTPFVAAKGKVYPACDADHMPPEAAVDSAFPPAEIAAFTDADGNGSVQFEVRSDVENESLGCNDRTACSIVVIPIVRHQLRPAATTPTTRGREGLPQDRSVPARLEQLRRTTASTRRSRRRCGGRRRTGSNRFSIPITFGLPPDACDILDIARADRASTAPSCWPRPRCSGRRRTA